MDTKEIKSKIVGLCENLLPKLPCSYMAMEYVNAGEYGLALEMLSDWCIDAEPEIVVSANEIIEFFNVCQGMKIKRPWVELLPLLNPQEIGNIPQNYIVLARDYIENEVVDNPVRREWLNKVASVINEIEEFA